MTLRQEEVMAGLRIAVVGDANKSHWRPDAPPIGIRPVGMTIALGFWASGIAGALFVLPQILALGQVQNASAARLLPFAALIGLLAGLTLDKVFPRLIKFEIPLDTRDLARKTPQGKAPRT
jgi:hypothetical protein